jgi:SAM-dependent MidA family methyltransferase
MQHCLYEPGLGYYSAGAAKFGAAGDFVTAPEISPLFAQTLANHAATLFAKGLDRSILEFGAGTGRLCGDFVQRLNALSVPWSSYRILEPSPDLQQRQREYLQQQLGARDLERIEWIETLPQGFNGLVLGNEVLDAMPVNVVVKDQSWVELGVGFEQQRFVWKGYSKTSDAVHRIMQIDADNSLAENYCTEVNLNFSAWCQGLAAACDRAVVLLVDYGYEQKQYYHASRTTGTLMCFYQHRAHPDPFIYPGLQDITAFVDFDALAEAGLKAGFSLTGMTTQAQFLMQNGLLELLQSQPQDELKQLTLAQQVKTLTLPGEMGERFKVIGMQTGLDLEMQGL